MKYEQAHNPEHPIETSFVETIYQLAGSQPLNRLGVQEATFDLESIELTEEERDAVGDSQYAHIQIIQFFFEGSNDMDPEMLEPEYLAEFYETVDGNNFIAHQYRRAAPGDLVYSSRLNVYENGQLVPGDDKKLIRMLGLPKEEREEGFITKIMEIMANRQEAEITPEDDPQRFETMTNLLRRFIR